MKKEIIPKWTLGDIYGSHLIFNPRASTYEPGWVPKDPMLADLRTGPPITVAGPMELICSEALQTVTALQLLNTAGIPIASNRNSYKSALEYNQLLASIKSQQKIMVLDHVHAAHEVAPEGYWINPLLLSFLNNKMHLDKLVPKEHLPRRKTIQPNDILGISIRQEFTLPFVLKVATDLPSGGGYDVVICRDEADLKTAYEQFRDCEVIIIEDYIEAKKNYCIQFAVTYKGEILDLGATEQLTTSTGRYLGNYTARDSKTPPLLVELGREIMSKAKSLGYVGVGGFDLLVSNDNRILAIDLNFRLNGSTPFLLLLDSVMQVNPSHSFMFRTWKSEKPLHYFYSVFQEMVDRGDIVPLALYDPSASPYDHAIPALSGILTGSSQEDLLSKERLLNSQGIK